MHLVRLSGAAMALWAIAAIPVHANESGVIAATEAWAAAFNSREPARVTATYVPDAILWGTTSKALVTSPGGVADYFKDLPNRALRVKFDSHHVQLLGEAATNAGLYTFTDTATGGSLVARYSMVFARRDGRWVLVHHHSSRVP